MDCPDCGGERRQVAVPDSLREYAPGGPSEGAIVVCSNCLRTWSTADVPDGSVLDDPRELSTALPADREAAVALLLFASLLSSVTGNRQSLDALFDGVERAGADPRLAVERLADDPDLDPAVDISRRFRQFEGLR